MELSEANDVEDYPFIEQFSFHSYVTLLNCLTSQFQNKCRFNPFSCFYFPLLHSMQFGCRFNLCWTSSRLVQKHTTR